MHARRLHSTAREVQPDNVRIAMSIAQHHRQLRQTEVRPLVAPCGGAEPEWHKGDGQQAHHCLTVLRPRQAATAEGLMPSPSC